MIEETTPHMEQPLRPLTVCYFGTYRAEYSRNQIMLRGLRMAGVTVVECHEPLWGSIEDRVQMVKGGWMSLGFARRVVGAYARLLRKYRAVGHYDVLMVGYPGQLDVLLARLLSWWKRKPLAWDIFMSIYLISVERGLDRKNRLPVLLLRWLERAAAALPNLLILDTAEYVHWFHRTHGTRPDRFRLVPTGADNHIFTPADGEDSGDGCFRVVYYGTFIPNHGVMKIMQAAQLLATRPEIVFEMIGDGPDRPAAEQMARENGLQNVRFFDWMNKEELVARAQTAAVCLGAFGDTPQSLMTVQNKIYEGLAMGRAVLTGDGPAVKNAFRHKIDLYLCPRQPEAIAEAVGVLVDDPALRRQLAVNGRAAYLANYTVEQLGLRFASHLRGLLPPGARTLR